MINCLSLYRKLMIKDESGCYDSHAEIFNEILEITKPKEILEIGFYRGGSANLWLLLSTANLTSVDPISDTVTNDSLKQKNKPIPSWEPQLNAVIKTYSNFPNRFSFIHKKSEHSHEDLQNKKFDLAWIDGDHWFNGVIKDIQLCLSLNIKYFAFDDFNRDVVAAYHNFEARFEVIKEWDKTVGINFEQQAILLARNKEYKE